MEQSRITAEARLELPPEAPPPDPPRRRRRWPWLALLLAALAGGGWLSLPLVVGRAIEAMMEADTGAQAHVHVAELTPGGLVMAPLVLGDDLRAERVAVRWRLPDLIDRRLDEVALSGVTARARFDADGLSLGAVDRLIETQHMQVERLSLPDSTALVTMPWGERALRFNAEKLGAVLTADGNIADLLRGQPLIEEAGSVSLTLNARRTEAGGMTAEVGLSGAALSGALSLHWARGRLRATVGEPLALTLARVPPDMIAAAPAEMRPLLAGRLALTLHPVGLGPTLRVVAGEGGQDVAAAFRAELAAEGSSRAGLELIGSGRLASDGVPDRLDLRRLSLEVADLPFGETRYDGALRLADLNGTPDGAAARLRLMLLARRLAVAGLLADEAALALTGRLDLAGDRMTYALSEAGSLYLKNARAPGVTVGQPLHLTVTGEVSAGRDWVVAPRLSLALPRLAAEVAGDSVAVEQLRATLAGTLARPELSATAESASVAGFGLVLKKLAAQLAPTPDGPRWSLSVREAAHGAALPLGLSAWATPQDGRLAFGGVASDAQGRVELVASGHHDPATGKGIAALTLKPVEFKPGGLQPRALLPELAKPFHEATGSVALTGSIGWDRSGWWPDLNILIKDVETRVAGVTLRKLNSVVKLTGLSPAASPPGQLLAVGVIDAGLPLTDAQMRFHVKDGRLVVEQASTRLAGGHVTVGEFVYDPKATRPQRFSLEVGDLDLGRLIELAELEGLTATGRLSGNVPLSLHGDRLTIDDARLISMDAGSVRYRPKEPPAFFNADESTRLVLKAFDNFEYDKMTMTLNGTIGGELTAGMHIAGSNPGLYGGYPIEFNLNLTGKLDRIIDEALVGYQIPAQIKERMSWFGTR